MVSSKEYPVGSKENPERGYVEKAMEALYDDKTYIAVGKKLYRFTGTYHEWQNIFVEQRRIAEWLSTYAEEVRPGKFVYKYATSACVRQVWRMVLTLFRHSRHIKTWNFYTERLSPFELEVWVPISLRSPDCPLSISFISWLQFLFFWSDKRALIAYAETPDKLILKPS